MGLGGSTELTINIEPGVSVASFALYDASRSVDTIVRGASGNVIELSTERNGFLRVEDPSTMLYLGYGFENPKPGPWKVTVVATDSTPPGGAEFAISVYFVGSAKLASGSSTLIPQLNQPVQLEASVLLNGQALQITQVQAVIRNPEGKVETIDFPAGQNSSVTWTPREAGTHSVDIVITALAPDGSFIEQDASEENEIISRWRAGQAQRRIARELGINRKRVARVVRAHHQGRESGGVHPDLPRPRKPRRGRQLEGFEPLLRELLEHYPQITVVRLLEELRGKGYCARGGGKICWRPWNVPSATTPMR